MSLSTGTAFRPALETMDERLQPSWVGVPPSAVSLTSAADWHANITGFSPTGYSTTSHFNGHEVDYRTFTAPRTGWYQFTAGANGSSVDTVAGLFTATGQRIAYNDDSYGTRDSAFGAQLTAGQTYVFGVTTYGYDTNAVPVGGYRASIGLPGLSASAHTLDFKTYADVNVTGNTMTIQLSGLSTGVFDQDTHRVRVRLMDRNNQPIHTGAWVRTLDTAGDWIPGTPTRATQRWTIDLTGFDVGRVAWIEVQASHY